MSTNNGLDAARDLARRQRDEAARLLAVARQGWLSQQMQLDQLQGYAQETDARWSLAAGRTSAPEVMHHHYQFMQRLDQAMAMQNKTMDAQARHVDECATALRAAETRLESLKQLLERREAGAAVQQRRKEQKQVDETAALQYRKLTSGQFAGGY